MIVGVVMESASCFQILVPCFQVVSCQEGGLDVQERQAPDCTWGATAVYHQDFASAACMFYDHKVFKKELSVSNSSYELIFLKIRAKYEHLFNKNTSKIRAKIRKYK